VGDQFPKLKLAFVPATERDASAKSVAPSKEEYAIRPSPPNDWQPQSPGQ